MSFVLRSGIRQSHLVGFPTPLQMALCAHIGLKSSRAATLRCDHVVVVGRWNGRDAAIEWARDPVSQVVFPQRHYLSQHTARRSAHRHMASFIERPVAVPGSFSQLLSSSPNMDALRALLMTVSPGTLRDPVTAVKTMQRIARLVTGSTNPTQRFRNVATTSGQLAQLLDMIVADILHAIREMDAKQIGWICAAVGRLAPILREHRVPLLRALDDRSLQLASQLDADSVLHVMESLARRKVSVRSPQPEEVLRACMERFVALQDSMRDEDVVHVMQHLAVSGMWHLVPVYQGKAIVNQLHTTIAHLPAPAFVSLLSSLATCKWNVNCMSTDIMDRVAEIAPTLAFGDASRLLWALARLQVDLQGHPMWLLDARIGELLTVVRTQQPSASTAATSLESGGQRHSAPDMPRGNPERHPAAKDVANVYWALALMKVRPSAATRMALEEHVVAHAGRMSTRQMANVLHAVASLDLPHSALLVETLMQRVETLTSTALRVDRDTSTAKQRGHYGAQLRKIGVAYVDVCTILWSAAVLSWVPPSPMYHILNPPPLAALEFIARESNHELRMVLEPARASNLKKARQAHARVTQLQQVFTVLASCAPARTENSSVAVPTDEAHVNVQEFLDRNQDLVSTIADIHRKQQVLDASKYQKVGSKLTNKFNHTTFSARVLRALSGLLPPGLESEVVLQRADRAFYTVDLWCPQHVLAIELDGYDHYTKECTPQQKAFGNRRLLGSTLFKHRILENGGVKVLSISLAEYPGKHATLLEEVAFLHNKLTHIGILPTGNEIST
eukprot:m.519619 g.519619  ORF g.519619 m.519619 type:complete len:789 (-) comp21947_c1_seq3:116-2482(-)